MVTSFYYDQGIITKPMASALLSGQLISKGYLVQPQETEDSEATAGTEFQPSAVDAV